MNVNRDRLEPHFVWQGPIQPGQVSVTPYDFGRDMTIRPRPHRYRRALMMVQRLPSAMAFLKSTIRQMRPDAIYTSQQMLDIYLADRLSRSYGIPHVIHLHYSVGPWLGRYTLNAIRKSRRLIAVSEFVRQTALLQGVLPSNVHTVVNPAPLLQPWTKPEQPTTRDEFHFGDDTPLIVAVGRIDPLKGHRALIDAFSEVIRQLPEARLLICGKSTALGNYEEQLRQRVAELQLTPFVIFAGSRSDVPLIMRSANVFCLPTELDPCPLVFLEAMTEGLPVVACHSGGVPELVLHDQTGLLSYPGDVSTMAANLLRILSDASYARRLGDAGRRRVTSVFAPANIAHRWFGILQDFTA